MEIMELSHELQSLNIVKPGKTFCNGLPTSITSQKFSPRVTRSQIPKDEKSLAVSPKVLETPTRVHKKNWNTEEDVKKIYLNKNVKIAHKNLETIYEDPITKKGSMLLLGNTKVKRSIYLNREFRITTKYKSKLRKIKIKRLGTKFRKCKISDDEFKQKMLSIDSYINSVNSDGDNGDDDEDADEDLKELPMSE